MLTDKEREYARANSRSIRQAVDLMCRDCIYDPAARGTWRRQVEDCPSKACPLWNFRPKRSARASVEETPVKALRLA